MITDAATAFKARLAWILDTAFIFNSLQVTFPHFDRISDHGKATTG
jgi:hypothetical protein